MAHCPECAAARVRDDVGSRRAAWKIFADSGVVWEHEESARRCRENRERRGAPSERRRVLDDHDALRNIEGEVSDSYQFENFCMVVSSIYIDMVDFTAVVDRVAAL